MVSVVSICPSHSLSLDCFRWQRETGGREGGREREGEEVGERERERGEGEREREGERKRERASD